MIEAEIWVASEALSATNVTSLGYSLKPKVHKDTLLNENHIETMSQLLIVASPPPSIKVKNFAAKLPTH